MTSTAAGEAAADGGAWRFLLAGIVIRQATAHFFLFFSFLSSAYKFCSTIFSTNKVYLRYFYSLECLSYVFLPKFLNNCLFKIFIPKGFVITFFCYQKVYIKLFFLSLNFFWPINFIQQYNIFCQHFFVLSFFILHQDHILLYNEFLLYTNDDMLY